jgi:hypothetical protein
VHTREQENGNLPKIEFSISEEIGFKWTLPSAIDRSEISFGQRIEDLKRFKEKHGHCDVSRFSKECTSLSV